MKGTVTITLEDFEILNGKAKELEEIRSKTREAFESYDAILSLVPDMDSVARRFNATTNVYALNYTNSGWKLSKRQ